MAEKTPEAAQVKKPRPQNKHLKPLGSGKLTPEEEHAIRSKGGKASCEKRWHGETFPIGQVLAKMMEKGMKPGTVTGIEEVESIADLDRLNPSGKAYIGLAELKRYLATGDKESRDFIWRKVEEYEQQQKVEEIAQRLADNGVCVDADKLALLNALQKQNTDRMLLIAIAAAMGLEIPDLSGDKKKDEDNSPAGVHIHLTRGEKPAGGEAKATHVTVGVDPDAGDEA